MRMQMEEKRNGTLRQSEAVKNGIRRNVSKYVKDRRRKGKKIPLKTKAAKKLLIVVT